MKWKSLGIQRKSNEKMSWENHSIFNVCFNMLQSAEFMKIIANFVGIIENQMELITHTTIKHKHTHTHMCV